MQKERKIGWELMGVTNLLRRCICYNQHHGFNEPISGMQHIIMVFLFENHGKQEVFQKDIEAKLHMRRSTATGILQNMEKNGLIIRRTAARDARLKELVLTDKALSIKEAADKRAKRIESEIKYGLTSDEQEELLRLLDKVKDNLNKLYEEESKSV
jgi:DNA-binding MarR family transcriptional regulator